MTTMWVLVYHRKYISIIEFVENLTPIQHRNCRFENQPNVIANGACLIVID